MGKPIVSVINEELYFQFCNPAIDDKGFAVRVDKVFTSNYVTGVIQALIDSTIDSITPVPNEVTALEEGGVTDAQPLAVGNNILTVGTVGDSVVLPLDAEVGDVVEVTADKRYSIFSITGALIADFANLTELQPDLDINGYTLVMRYVKHGNGKWYYSNLHTEL